MTRLLAILFLTSCLTSTVVAADVDLSQSKITPEAEKVPGGMMLTVNVVLKNTGDKPSDGTDLTISFPARLIRRSGEVQNAPETVSSFNRQPEACVLRNTANIGNTPKRARLRLAVKRALAKPP